MEQSEATVSPPIDLGRCFNDALDVWKKNWTLLVLSSFLLHVLSGFSLFVLTGPLFGGVCVMTLHALRREDHSVDLGEMFGSFGKFLPLVGLFFLTSIATIFGLMLCVLPGVWLSTIWLFCFTLMVDKDLGLFAALRVSKDIVSYKGFWWNLLVGVICFGINASPGVVPYLGAVISIIVAPIGWLVVMSAYIQQVDGDSGHLHDLIEAERACERADADV